MKIMWSLIRKFYKSIIIAVFILILSIIKPDNFPENAWISFPFSDKIAHFSMYAVFSFFLLGDFHNITSGKRYRKIGMPLMLAILFGISVEMLQWFTVTRSAEILDAVFNTFGSLFGLVMYGFITYFKALVADLRS
jgi:VanZ family protein